jgi:hypothetical protein
MTAPMFVACSSCRRTQTRGGLRDVKPLIGWRKTRSLNADVVLGFEPTTRKLRSALSHRRAGATD